MNSKSNFVTLRNLSMTHHLPIELYVIIYSYSNTECRQKLKFLNKAIRESIQNTKRIRLPYDRIQIINLRFNDTKNWCLYPIDFDTISLTNITTNYTITKARLKTSTVDDIVIVSGDHQWSIGVESIPLFVECSSRWCRECTPYDGSMYLYYRDLSETLVYELLETISICTKLMISVIHFTSD